jgi:heat shock protein HtpX
MKWFKTTLLMAILTALFIWIGHLIGGKQGALVALIFAGLMNFMAYWFSDKIVLMMYGAKEIKENELPGLFRIVRELCQRANLPMPRLYLIDTDSPNAFATGRNPKNAAVAVTKGLLKLLDEAELKGVIGHELSHIKNRDILISTIAATLAGALSYLAMMARWSLFFGGFGGSSEEDRGGNIFGLLGLIVFTTLAAFAAMLIQLAISRTREYLADEGGAKLCGNPRFLARALAKLDAFAKRLPLEVNPATSHMFIVNPLRTKDILTLFSTHPPIEERIRRLEMIARRMGI